MSLLQGHEATVAVPHLPQPRGEVRVYELDLVATPSAIPCARLLVGYAAIKWQLDRSCEAELAAVAEALVGQAVAAQHDKSDALNYLAFRLRLVPRAVVIEVWDACTEAPRSLPASTAGDGGYDFPGRGRRVMWCAVRTSLAHVPGLNTEAGIPRRERLQGPARASVAIQDQQLLQRVLNGLKTLGSDQSSSSHSI